MPTLDLKKAERKIEFEVLTDIRSSITQKRCFIAELVKKSLQKYLAETNFTVDNSFSLYNLPLINDELHLIDFEINSYSVHVIATIDKAKNEYVYIPKAYKQFSYQPDFTVFVNLSKTLNKMEIVGYATELDLNDLTIEKSKLLPEKNLISAISETSATKNSISKSALKTTQELMFAYIEDDLSDEGKRFFLKYMISSTEVRKNYKLFYTLNRDFISIAKDRTIDKPYPEETKSELDYSLFYKEPESNQQEEEPEKQEQEPEKQEDQSFNFEEQPLLLEEPATFSQITLEEEPIQVSEETVTYTFEEQEQENDDVEILELEEEPIEEAFEEETSMFEKDIDFLENDEENTFIADSMEEELLFDEEETEEPAEETIELATEEEPIYENFARTSFLIDPQEESLEENVLTEANIIEEETPVQSEELLLEISDPDSIDNIQFDETEAETLIMEDSADNEEEFILEDTGEDNLLLEDSGTEELLLESNEENTDDNFTLEEVGASDELILEMADSGNSEDLLIEDVEETSEESIFSEENIFEQDTNEDISNELTEEEPLFEEIEEVPEIEEIPTVEEATTEDDDLFSFLSDMANDPEITGQTTVDATTQEYEMEDISSDEELNDVFDENENQMQEAVAYSQNYNEEVLYEEPAEQVYQEESPMIQSSFDATQQENLTTASMFAAQQENIQPQAKKASAGGSKALLATFALISLAGYGIYMYKDTILSTFGMGEDVPSMEEEMVLPSANENVPPPVAAVPTPPAPTAVPEAEKANEPQPAPQEAAPAQPSPAPAPVPVTTAEKVPTDTTKNLPKLPTSVEPPKPKHINDAIANALAKDFNGVRIAKVSWEISETLAQNPEVNRYLTITGKTVKSTLAQELLAATEPSFNSYIHVLMTYRKDGSVAKVVIDKSSGSKQIDDIILKTIKEILNVVKMPALNIDRAEYNAKLIIKL